MSIQMSSTAVTAADMDELRTQIHGIVVLPGDDTYDEVRQIWNKMHDKRPALISRCLGAADVIASVKFARRHNLPVAVRGGGHNVAGSASIDDGMMIDLSLMRGVDVNPETRLVRAQGGATIRDLDCETAVFGLVVPMGVFSETGIAGLTLGGGYGWLRRKYGLSIDNLVSVDLITADGTFVKASETQNEDLFWGIRGGGGNFGIVTTFTYRAHPIAPEVMFAAPWYSVEHAEQVLTVWRDFMATAPDEITSLALFWSVPAIPDIPENLHGKRAVIINAVHCGPADEGERILRPLREIATPLLDFSGKMNFSDVQQLFDPFFPKGEQYAYYKSKYIDRLDAETIEAILPRATHPPHPKVLIVLWHNGGQMARVPADATAFMGRDAPYLFSVDCLWDDAEDSDRVIAYARQFLADMDRFSPGGLYVNFAGLGEEGEALVKDAYGDHYSRLVALKNKYDPTNFFQLNQNIKPSLEAT